MKAAESMGIVSKVKWGSSTPIANTFMSGQFSPAFDGHLWINSEFGLLDVAGPDTRLMLAIQKKYAPSIVIAGLRPDGFMDAKFVTNGPAQHQGVRSPPSRQPGGSQPEERPRTSCKPWYVGNALPYHIPNNTDITVDYKDGRAEGEVFDIAPVDKEIAPDTDLGEEVQPEHEVTQTNRE